VILLFIANKMRDGGWGSEGSYLCPVYVPLHNPAVISPGNQLVVALKKQYAVDCSTVGLPFVDMSALRHLPQPDVAAPATTGCKIGIIGECQGAATGVCILVYDLGRVPLDIADTGSNEQADQKIRDEADGCHDFGILSGAT